MQKFTNYIWGVLRLSMGWIFLWSFLDKTFGLGFDTAREAAWINGGSPTFGFLNFATKGPFDEIFKAIAGSAVLDWVFMLALLLGGIALLLGVFVRLASYGGALLLLLMYLAGFLPPEHNPFLDEHILQIIIFLGLSSSHSGRWLGLGKWWSGTSLVKRYSIFE